jgi:hypothetical protein
MALLVSADRQRSARNLRHVLVGAGREIFGADQAPKRRVKGALRPATPVRAFHSHGSRVLKSLFGPIALATESTRLLHALAVAEALCANVT